MKAIPETRHAHQIYYLRLYTLQNTQDVSQQQLTLPLKHIEMIILE